MMPTSEGYYDFLSNAYIYNYTDHLGNVRLSYSDSNKDGAIQPRRYFYQQCSGPWDPFNPPICIDSYKPGEIVEVNNYYPFGLLHNYTGTTQNAYQYKYNGKELQETGMYDYGARFYMPEVGRWGVVDPLAEASRRFSPYVYGNNNPVRFIDPDGRLSQSTIQSMLASPSGTTWYNTGSGFASDRGDRPIDYEGNPIWESNYGGIAQSTGLGSMGEGGGGPNPKNSPGPGFVGFLSNFFGKLFGTAKRDAKISTFLPGAVITRIPSVEVGTLEGSFETALNWEEIAAVLGTISRAGRFAIPLMLNGDSSHARGYDIPLTGAIDVPGDEPQNNLYLYRNMRSVNGMPMVGEGLDKLGLRDRDVDNLSNSTRITSSFENGLSVTVGYGNIIPSNVPFGSKKTTLYRISASSLMSYGLIGMPVPNPDIPNYGQIRPAIPMNVGTFRALIQSTAPAWQRVK